MKKRINHNGNEWTGIPMPEIKPLNIIREEIARIHINRIFLRDHISEASDYNEILNILDTCQDDLFEIHINTPGGYLDTTIPLIYRIRNLNEDNVVTVIEQASSAGSIIALASKNVMVIDHASMFIHDLQIYPAPGDASKAESYVAFSKKTKEKLFFDIYKYFLTDEEINQVLAGKDFYFEAEEIRRRLEIRKKLWKDKDKTDSVENKKNEDNKIIKVNKKKKALK